MIFGSSKVIGFCCLHLSGINWGMVKSNQEIERVGDVLELEIPAWFKHVVLAGGLCLMAFWVYIYFTGDSTGQAEKTILYTFGPLGLLMAFGAVLSYFIDLMPDTFLDSEGFKLSSSKIPWTDVLNISVKKIETRKRTEHYINVIFKEDSPHKGKTGVLKKMGQLRTGKADFKFQARLYHGIGVDELFEEMKKRWKATMKESSVPGIVGSDKPERGKEMSFLEE